MPRAKAKTKSAATKSSTKSVRNTSVRSAAASSKSVSSKPKTQEIELDVNALLMPFAVIIAAIIVSVPISLSIYFGLKDANLGSVAGDVSAYECDSSDPLTKDCYLQYADELGLDVEEFGQCLDEATYDNKIDEELSYGTEIGVQGTPTILIGENQGGDKMKGFIVGSGRSEAELSRLVEAVKSKGIDALAKEEKQKQTDDLDSYETQLRDYYTQQGQTGDVLKASIDQGLQAKKDQIESEVQVKEYTFGDGHLRGDKDSKAVIMEFSDYECPYCQQFAQTDGGLYVKGAADSGDLLFIYRDFPLESIHPKARGAANAARCAGQDDAEVYFKYHDRLFGVADEE